MLKNILTFVALIAFTFSVASAGKVDDIIAKAKKATGADKAKNIKSLVVSSTSEVNQMGQKMTIDSKLIYKSPDKYKMVQTVQGQEMVTVVTPSSAWMINPMMGSTEPQDVPSQFMDQVRTSSESQKNMIMGPFADDNENTEFKLAGREKIDGKDCYKVNAKDKKEDQEATIFISKESYLVKKFITEQTGQNGQPATVEVYFKDYKTFDGITMATKVEIMQNGQLLATQTNKDVKINTDIADSEFNKPGQ